MPPTRLDQVAAEPRGDGLTAVCFTAMASPCELLISGLDELKALEHGRLVAREVWRIEYKYSRYRNGSVICWVHQNRGKNLVMDEETAALLNFAGSCYEVSDGL